MKKLWKPFANALNALTLAVLGGWLFMMFMSCVLVCGVLFLTGCCGGENADVVVVNDSGRAVYTVTVEYANSSETVTSANGKPLLEVGQTFGLELEEDEATIILQDLARRTISRSRVARQEGQRLFLTVDGVTEGSVSVEESWPNG